VTDRSSRDRRRSAASRYPSVMVDSVSIVVITRNRRDRVLDTLPRLRAASPDAPLIVVDDASEDDTAGAVRSRHPEVTVLRNETNLGAAARTVGVRAARTAYVAFADDDSWYAPGALELAAAILDGDDRIGLVVGAVTVEPGGHPDPINAVLAASPLRDHGLPGPQVLGFIACAAVVRRAAYLAVGGFDPRLQIGGEEELLALDLATAGWRCVHVEGLGAHHHPDARDPRPGRRQRLARNRVWTAWLRRPAGVAAAVTARTAATAVRDTDERAGLVAAVRGLPHVLRDRRPLPAEVERAKRTVERSG
jgi:GT2 family glycosyltransferase